MRIKLNRDNILKLGAASRPYEVYDTETPGFLLRVQPSEVMTYYFAYRLADGTKRRCRIGRHPATTPEIARARAKGFAGDVARGGDPVADKAAEKKKKQVAKQEAEKLKAATFSGFIEHHYRDHCLSSMKTGKHTLSVLESAFAEFQSLPLQEITELRLVKWRNKRLQDGAKASGINRWIKALSAMLSRAVEWGVIPRNNLSGITHLSVDTSANVRFLSDDEARRLRDALDRREVVNRDRRKRFNAWREARGLPTLPERLEHFTDHLKPLVLLALNTGMRRGELFKLQWQDVDLKRRMLTVHGANAKTDTTRHIPLNDEAVAVLTAWRNQCEQNQAGLVFKSPKAKTPGGALDNINNSWRALLQDAGISGFRFHDLRHTFASWLVMRSVDLNTVRDLLGHTDIKMTLRYAHLAPEHKAAAVAVLNSKA